MCFRDYGVMRLVRSILHDIPDTTFPDTIIPANQNRIALSVQSFDPSLANAPFPYIEDSITGFLLFSGTLATNSYYINSLTHGDLPTHKMTVNFAAAQQTDEASWIEWVVPEQWLDKALRAMEKEFGGPF